MTLFVPVTPKSQVLLGPLASAERKAINRGLYSSEHKRLRATFAPRVAAGAVDCARCRRPIKPGEAWDLGHVDGDPTRYAGPKHRRCNWGAPSRNLDGRAGASQPRSRDW